MDYCLLRRVLDSVAFVAITEDEYKVIQQARNGLMECLFMEEKFDLLIENYFEFEMSLLEISTRSMVRFQHDYRSLHLERNLIDRRIVNLLTSGRVYIDHTKQHVHRILPVASNDNFDVNTAFSHQYDTRVGYRCMEALRNHVQHRGFPVHNITFERQWVEHEGKKLMLFAISPYVEPAHLREDGEFKKIILEEMEAMNNKIDLKGLVRDYVEGLAYVHSEIRQRLRDLVQQWDGVLREAITHFQSSYPEEGIVGLAAIKRHDDGTHKETVPVFTEFIDQRLYFEKKNDALINITKRFVTSEVIEKQAM